ncbi:unnamed protein product [Euphydryas editha]|uniref:Uncharacterized protein n=1 Tax=Euphydryas editha TaxID=104508 RepID=A0AAU9TQN2_EUPED|nr:unnamed protein product [Euphydryas editha]
MSARCKKLLELGMKQEDSEDLAVKQSVREPTPLAQQDILQSLPGPSGNPAAQQDIFQSLAGPSGNRAYTSDHTSLGEDYSSDDDVQDCTWIPAGTHDEHVSSSSSSKTSTPRSIGSIAVPVLVSQTQDDVRGKRLV